MGIYRVDEMMLCLTVWRIKKIFTPSDAEIYTVNG